MGLRKEMRDVAQDIEAKAKTALDKAQGKHASKTWNKAKIKIRDAANDLRRHI